MCKRKTAGAGALGDRDDEEEEEQEEEEEDVRVLIEGYRACVWPTASAGRFLSSNLYHNQEKKYKTQIPGASDL